MADNDDQSNKELREKLEAALAQNKTLLESQQTLQAQVLMPHLNERQRRVVMRELAEDKLDPTAENVTQVAEDLGYKLEPDPPPTTPTTDTTDKTVTDNNGQEDPGIMVSLDTMNAIDQAHYNAAQGNLSPDLETEMRGAKTREELRNVVRTKGHKSGIVHEWDDQ